MGFFSRRGSRKREEPAAPRPLQIERPVWFLLIEAEVLARSSLHQWQPGSTAMIQTFVPGRVLEDALVLLDAYLGTEGMKRIDTVRAVRYDPGDDDSNLPGEYFQEPLEQAANRNECTLGIFIVSRDTAWPEGGWPEE